MADGCTFKWFTNDENVPMFDLSKYAFLTSLQLNTATGILDFVSGLFQIRKWIIYGRPVIISTWSNLLKLCFRLKWQTCLHRQPVALQLCRRVDIRRNFSQAFDADKMLFVAFPAKTKHIFIFCQHDLAKFFVCLPTWICGPITFINMISV